MSELTQVIKHQYMDANGAPLAGGLLYTYVAGTTTPLATYTDQSGATPNTNPIVLDSSGRCDIWLASSNYKFVLKDINSVLQWTVDNVKSVSAQIAAISSNFRKVTVSYTQLQTAALSNAILAFSIPAANILRNVTIKHSQQFSGGSISALTVQVGPNGAYDEFIEKFDAFQSVGDQVFDNSVENYIGSFANPTSIFINATAVGANLSALTQGSVDIYYEYQALAPS